MYPHTFESLSLREALILSLGSINIGRTFDEVMETLEVFSAIRPDTLAYTNVSIIQVINLLKKLEKYELIVMQNLSEENNKIIPTVKLSQKGLEEYQQLVEKFKNTIVEDRMLNIREYFELAS